MLTNSASSAKKYALSDGARGAGQGVELWGTSKSEMINGEQGRVWMGGAVVLCCRMAKNERKKGKTKDKNTNKKKGKHRQMAHSCDFKRKSTTSCFLFFTVQKIVATFRSFTSCVCPNSNSDEILSHNQLETKNQKKNKNNDDSKK